MNNEQDSLYISQDKLEYTIDTVETIDEYDLEISADSDDKRVYPMKSIKVEKRFYTFFELYRKFKKTPTQIIMDSDFQRKEVWFLQQKRELIESILMRLPLPIFYFNQDRSGRLIVIDGRQRLNAVFSFINNEFSLDKLKILPEFNKMRFRDLSALHQSDIEDYQAIAHVILPDTPDRVKFDIFDRVNRAGTKLNKQEIRNALYQGYATRLLNEIVDSSEFSKATEDAFKKDTRMKNRYLVIRFLAFYLFQNDLLYKSKMKRELYQYSGDIDDFLGTTMEFINHMSASEVDKLKTTTLDALKKVSEYIGENAFRLVKIEDGKVKRYPINMNIFETLLYGMTLIPENTSVDTDALKEKVNSLKNDDLFLDSLNNHRDSESKVQLRFNMIQKSVGECYDN